MKTRKTLDPKIDYPNALRDVAKSMVHLKRPERLLKMITRFIDRQLGLTHTSLLVLQEKRDRFIFVDSKGRGRIPIGLIRFDLDHPLVLWFRKDNRHFINQDYLVRSQLALLKNGKSKRRFRNIPSEEVDRVVKAMAMLKIELAIPSYYKDVLLGLLLLGKKQKGNGFTSQEISFFQTLAQDCSMAVKTAEYHESLLRQNKELAQRVDEIERLRKKEHDTFYQIMRSLAQQVFAKDTYTFGHVHQVERLGMLTAKELGMDLSGKRGDILSASLILHDVGKIGIPDAILKKKGPLDPQEWKIMKTHVDKGRDILNHLSDFKEVKDVVYSHHEKFDGSGYPRGLKGAQIPIEARIVSVVDAFHAIVSTRCYRKGRPIGVAFEELRRCAGTQFDPKVVEAFIRGLEKEIKKRGVGFFMGESASQHEA